MTNVGGFFEKTEPLPLIPVQILVTSNIHLLIHEYNYSNDGVKRLTIVQILVSDGVNHSDDGAVYSGVGVSYSIDVQILVIVVQILVSDEVNSINDEPN